jgi:hypothetical protein
MGIGLGFTSKFWKGVEIGLGAAAGRAGREGEIALGIGHHNNPIERPMAKNTKQDTKMRNLRFIGLFQKQVACFLSSANTIEQDL